MTQTLVDFLAARTNGASNRAMAERIGMTHTTLKAQLMSDKTPGLTLAMLCRAYGISFNEAAIAAGWVNWGEVRDFVATAMLSEVSDLELSKEMLRRVVAGTASEAITEPTSETVISEVIRESEEVAEFKERSAREAKVASELRSAQVRDSVQPSQTPER